MGIQEAEMSVLSRLYLQKYDDNGRSLAPARLIAKKEAAERRRSWERRRREGCVGNEGLDGEIWTSQRSKFNLPHVHFVTVIEHPLHGNFIDVHFTIFFFL